ncbi:MAG: PKD domain-containing protein [Bacteroidota bacterium]
MKKGREYKDIEELFRDKLAEREYPVRESFWHDFSGKLSRREFLRFNPGSFNIYYLAGLIAAAAITVAVLLNDNDSPREDTSADIVIKHDTLQNSIRNIIIEKESSGEQKMELEEVPVKDEEAGHPDRQAFGKQEEVVVAEEQEKAETEEKKTGSNKINNLASNDSFVTETKAEPAPVATFVPELSEGCAPLSIYFRNMSHNYDSCLWEFDDGGTSTDDNPVWIYDEEGIYEVRLVLFGNDGSIITERGKVTVYPKPEARFEISEGNPSLPDEQVRFYNFSQNASEWEWDFGDGTVSNEFEPAHFYDRPGSYTVKLKAISEYGCVDSMVITNAFENNSCYIKFPNAFVPNEGGPTGGYYSARSDQQEEVFHPVYSGVTSYNLRVYSRRGILVFESNDIQVGWDGYYKGQKAEPGVYIWKARGTFKNGEPFVKGGDLTLLPKW